MSTLCTLFGYLYDPAGTPIRSGSLTLRLQQDMVSVDGNKIAPFTLTQSLLPLVTPGAPTVAQVGAPGSTSYKYQVVAFDGAGNPTLAGASTTSATGNATLSGSDYNHITWAAVPGAVTYGIYGRSGTLTLLATSPTNSYDDKGVSAVGTALPTSNTTGGYVYVQVSPNVGATPAGLAYFVEYDPSPTDTSQPSRNKDGYWSNYWAVPTIGTQPIGNFVSANRGLPMVNYLPLSGVITAVADVVTMGTSALNDKRLIAGNSTGGSAPEIRFNHLTSLWELSNDGSTFNRIDTSSISAITNVIAGTGLSGGGSSGAVTVNIATQSFPTWLTAMAWSVVDKTGSSLADIATRSAGDLSSGTLPLARLSNIADAQISATAAIAWSKLSKSGSSLLDLATRSASDLSSGILPDARFPATLPAVSGVNLTALNASNLGSGTIPSGVFPATLPSLNGTNLNSLNASNLSSGGVPTARLTGVITNSEVNASAAIAYSKLALTGALLNADINASAAIAYSKLALTGTILNADINASAAIAYSKLALSGAILATDIATAAGIPYSKLTLTGALVNADISASAAIAYSKLALTGAILAADIAASAGIPYSKLTLTGAVVNADIASAAAIAYSKLNLTGLITNTDISTSAAIAYSKLALTNLLVNSDINTGAAIDWAKINKATSSIADLATRSATDIDSGTLASARMSIAGTSSATRGAAYVDNTTITVDGAGKLTATAPIARLRAASGTNTTTAPANMDTVAISGLTALDTLEVYVTLGSTTQLTSAPRLYNATDSVDIIVSPTNVLTSGVTQFKITIRQRQKSATSVVANGAINNTDSGTNPDSTNLIANPTFTTAWTGSWTLALRHNGVTSGGTCDYSWAVYKVSGQ